MAAPRFYSPLLYPLVGVIGGIYLQSVCNVSCSWLLAGLLGSLLVNTVLTLLSKIDVEKPARGECWPHPSIHALCAHSGRAANVSNHAGVRRKLFERSISWLRRTYFGPWLFVVSFACLGGLMVSLHHWHNQQLFDALGNEPIQCLATVVDKGEWGADGKGCLVRVSVHEVFTWVGAPHQCISFDLLCYSRVPLGVAVGDTVLMRRMVIKQAPALHNDKPGYQEYLAKEGIAAAVFLCGGYQCRTVARPVFSPRRWAWQLRDRVFTALRAKMAPLTASYFGLIFLGNKQQPHNEALREIFCRWGLAHYLARAGLHIVFFIMIWTWLLGLLPLHIQVRRLLLIALCVLYDCLSWSSIPFSRAYYAFLLTQFGQWRYRQTNYLHLLTIICLLILAFNPLQLFFLDFQLTFALTFTLVFVAYLSAP